MAHVIVGAAFIDELIGRISLLGPDLVGTGVNGMTESVQSGEREPTRKAMRELGDHEGGTGIDIGKGDEDSSKSVIPHDHWRRTGGVRRTARYPIGAGTLNSIDIAVESVTRPEPIHINVPYQLATSTSLVTDGELPVPDGLKLGLQRINIDIGSRLVRKGAKDVHFENLGTSGIAAERSVRGHAKSKVRIWGVTRCEAIGSDSIQDTRAWRRSVNLAWIKKAASADLGRIWGILPNVAEFRIKWPVKEDSKTASDHRSLPKYVRAVGEAKARTEVVFVRVVQLIHGLDRAVHETLRAEDVIAHEALGFVQGRKVFPAKAKIERQIRTEFPVILNK